MTADCLRATRRCGRRSFASCWQRRLHRREWSTWPWPGRAPWRRWRRAPIHLHRRRRVRLGGRAFHFFADRRTRAISAASLKRSGANDGALTAENADRRGPTFPPHPVQSRAVPCRNGSQMRRCPCNAQPIRESSGRNGAGLSVLLRRSLQPLGGCGRSISGPVSHRGPQDPIPRVHGIRDRVLCRPRADILSRRQSLRKERSDPADSARPHIAAASRSAYCSSDRATLASGSISAGVHASPQRRANAAASRRRSSISTQAAA